MNKDTNLLEFEWPNELRNELPDWSDPMWNGFTKLSNLIGQSTQNNGKSNKNLSEFEWPNNVRTNYNQDKLAEYLLGDPRVNGLLFKSNPKKNNGKSNASSHPKQNNGKSKKNLLEFEWPNNVRPNSNGKLEEYLLGEPRVNGLSFQSHPKQNNGESTFVFDPGYIIPPSHSKQNNGESNASGNPKQNNGKSTFVFDPGYIIPPSHPKQNNGKSNASSNVRPNSNGKLEEYLLGQPRVNGLLFQSHPKQNNGKSNASSNVRPNSNGKLEEYLLGQPRVNGLLFQSHPKQNNGKSNASSNLKQNNGNSNKLNSKSNQLNSTFYFDPIYANQLSQSSQNNGNSKALIIPSQLNKNSGESEVLEKQWTTIYPALNKPFEFNSSYY
jgi:hypothetical protein